MKSICNLLPLLFFCTAGVTSFAQNETDIINYGVTHPSGSGRYIGMGGAYNALGGDITAISSNPAGLGVFLSNEFNLSAGFIGNGTTANYLGKINENLETRLIIPSFGIVSGNPLKASNGKWKMVNLSYSYNRVKDFYTTTAFRATNPNNSLANQFADDAYGVRETDLANRFPFTSSLAYNTYLIDPDTLAPDYAYSTKFGPGNVKQNYTTSTKGRIGENVFAIGSNYDNKLYLGGSVTISSVSRLLEEVYREENLNPNHEISEFTYKYNLSSQGTGYSAKIGMIYRVAENLRMGLSLQTRTTFRMNEEFYADMSTKYVDQNSPYTDGSDIYQMRYNIITPGRLGFGAAYLFGKKGLISFDYNRSDFGRSEFKNQQVTYGDKATYDFADANNQLRSLLAATNEFKIGGEFKVKKMAFRAGYRYQDNPYKQSLLVFATSASTVSFGIGTSFDNVSFDLGIANTQFTDDYAPYAIVGQTSVKNSITNGTLSIVVRY